MPKKTVTEETKTVAPVVAPTPAPAAAPAKKAKAAVSDTASKSAASSATTATAATVATTVGEEGEQRPGHRYFRCVHSDETFGRFSGLKPKQAAGKALTSILRKIKESGGDLTQEINFSMVECTRGRTHKVSNYRGRRVKLPQPIKVTLKKTGRTVEYNYQNKVTKVKGQEGGAAAPKAPRKAVKGKAAKKTTGKAKAAPKQAAAPTPVVEAAAPVPAAPAKKGKAAAAAAPAPVPAPVAPTKKGKAAAAVATPAPEPVVAATPAKKEKKAAK